MGCVYRSTHGTHRINAYTLCVTRLRFSIHTRSANIYGIYCFHIFFHSICVSWCLNWIDLIAVNIAIPPSISSFLCCLKGPNIFRVFGKNNLPWLPPSTHRFWPNEMPVINVPITFNARTDDWPINANSFRLENWFGRMALPEYGVSVGFCWAAINLN